MHTYHTYISYHTNDEDPTYHIHSARSQAAMYVLRRRIKVCRRMKKFNQWVRLSSSLSQRYICMGPSWCDTESSLYMSKEIGSYGSMREREGSEPSPLPWGLLIWTFFWSLANQKKKQVLSPSTLHSKETKRNFLPPQPVVRHKPHHPSRHLIIYNNAQKKIPPTEKKGILINQFG